MALGRAYIEIHADTKPFRKDLDNDVKKTLRDSTKGIGKAATDGISNGLKSFRFIPGTFQGVFISGLVGVIIAAAPAISAAIQGLLSTAFGLAGIGAGIALAISQSSELQDAFKELGGRIFNSLQSAATVFLTPIEHAVQDLGRSFDRILPDIQASFAALAPFVDDVVRGITGFVENIMPGLRRAFENSGPALMQFSIELSHLGTTLGDFISTLTDDPEVLVEGLKFAFLALNVTLAGTVQILDLLGQSFAAYQEAASDFSTVFAPFSAAALIYKDNIADTDGIIRGLVPITNEYTDALGRQGQGANYAAVQGNGLLETLREIYNVQLAASNASIAYEQSIDDLSETLADNGRTIDINTQKGRDNVTAVNASIAAAIREHEAAIAAGASIEETNEVYRARIRELQNTLRAAGFTEEAIAELTAAYVKVPDSLTTKVTAPGLPGVLTQAEALNNQLRQLRREVLINIRASTPGAIGGRAEGGVVTKPEISWIGEAGPEAVVPLTDPARAQQVMAEAGLMTPMTINIIVDGEVIERRVIRTNESQARQINSQPRSI